MEGRYNFTDSSYDGLVEGNSLSSGLGMLTDGHLAPVNYANTDGVGWIGWNAKDTPDPYIMFEFFSTRLFHSVTIHCNVRGEANVKLFSNVTVRFGEDGATFDKTLSFKPKQISSGIGWENYNVTIDLCKHVGKFMELKFTYAGHWILISEITFNSSKFKDLCCWKTVTELSSSSESAVPLHYWDFILHLLGLILFHSVIPRWTKCVGISVKYLEWYMILTQSYFPFIALLPWNLLCFNISTCILNFFSPKSCTFQTIYITILYILGYIIVSCFAQLF